MLVFGIDRFMSECRALRTGKPHPEPVAEQAASLPEVRRRKPEPLGAHPRPGFSSRHAREERTPDAYARLSPATTGRAQLSHNGMSRRADVGEVDDSVTAPDSARRAR